MKCTAQQVKILFSNCDEEEQSNMSASMRNVARAGVASELLGIRSILLDPKQNVGLPIEHADMMTVTTF